MVLADDVLGYGETKAGAVGAAADHRIKNPLQVAWIDPRPVVDDVDTHDLPMAHFANGKLSGDAGLQGNFCSGCTAQCLASIARDIQDRLNDLIPIRLDIGQTWIVVAYPLDLVGEF